MTTSPVRDNYPSFKNLEINTIDFVAPFNKQTRKGIGINSTREEILEKYKENEHEVDIKGDSAISILDKNERVSFHLNQEGVVNRIRIW